jgi:hypothetical protein
MLVLEGGDAMRTSAALGYALLVIGLSLACSVEQGPCPGGFTDCQGRCLYLDRDFKNCGACGVSCGSLDMACSRGECIPNCGAAVASDAETLIALLEDGSLSGIDALVPYIRIEGRIELTADDIGPGAMFRDGGRDLTGITLEDEITYGTDPELSSTCCLYSYFHGTHTAYRRASFEDVSFMRSRSLTEGGWGECDENCVFHSLAGTTPMLCTDWNPVGVCCCAADAIYWDIITITGLHESCLDVEECAGYTGNHPSVCYESYRDYVMRQSAVVHEDCFDGTGHIREDHRCTCDYWAQTYRGSCNGSGECVVPPMVGEGAPPPQGCVSE